MTERKRAGESWESLIERQIREARAEGRFDQIEGAGRPLADAEAPYDPNWWTKRLIERERVSELPPALAIRSRVERELDGLFALESEEAVVSYVATHRGAIGYVSLSARLQDVKVLELR